MRRGPATRSVPALADVKRLIGPHLPGYYVMGGVVEISTRRELGNRVGRTDDRPVVTQSSMEDGAFTIDEHRARTRHFDLWLIHDGTESLWAVASEMPAPGEGPQVAIRIEDSPFGRRGGIAAQSNRTPWDHGRMSLRTWHEGEAAVVTLHGSIGGGLGGARTVSLRHVGSIGGDDDDQWTIVAFKEAS